VFVAAATASAATVGAITGWLGSLVLRITPELHFYSLIGLAGVSITYGTAELHSAKWRVPSRTWIIPKRWALLGNVPFAFAFGSVLGAGFLTIITFIGYHVLLISCFSLADWRVGGELMSIFGLARALPVLLTPITYSRFGMYDAKAALQADQWFTKVQGRLWILRSMTLFAMAGSSIAALTR
jgi:hypothetical protein